MRFIRNKIQTPKRFLTSKARKSVPFYSLLTGVAIFSIGVAGFFLAFLYRNPINEFWTNSYREVQTYGVYCAAVGIFIYSVSAIILKIPLRKTTFYKIETILKDEPFDPRKKGDFTKPILTRLTDLDDKWALLAQVNPPNTGFIIPQIIVGPGGVFSTYPLTNHPDRRYFKDPGPPLIKASKILGDAIGQNVTPIIVFSTKKLVQIYRKKRDAKTLTMHTLELEDYFGKRKKKFTDSQRTKIEEMVFNMIKGTAPGE